MLFLSHFSGNLSLKWFFLHEQSVAVMEIWGLEDLKSFRVVLGIVKLEDWYRGNVTLNSCVL